jgi:hypothetical protein
VKILLFPVPNIKKSIPFDKFLGFAHCNFWQEPNVYEDEYGALVE